MLGIPAYRDFPAATAISLFETAQLCERGGIELLLCVVSDCSVGAFAARNLVAHEFLKSDCSYLFWLDADMSWVPDDFIRLLNSGRPFVAASYARKRERSETVKGLGFACVSREVMEAIAAIKPLAKCHGRKEPVRQIFHCGVMDGKLMGEDYLFCKDIEALGYPVNIMPDIKLGHIGTKEYR